MSERIAQVIQITWKRSLCASNTPKTTPAGGALASHPHPPDGQGSDRGGAGDAD